MSDVYLVWTEYEMWPELNTTVAEKAMLDDEPSLHRKPEEETCFYKINVEVKHERYMSSRRVYSSQMYFQSSLCFVYLYILLWCAPRYWLNPADLAMKEYREPGLD